MAIPRVVGIETEYGISRRSAATREIYDEAGQDQFADTNRVITAYAGLPVQWDYGAEKELPDIGNVRLIENVVLPNGARFYHDHGHPEYSTPECATARQAVIWDKAGERILHRASTAAMQLLRRDPRFTKDSLAIFKNNTDSHGATYGCHENYLIERKTPWGALVDFMIPYLVTRQVFTGAGKIGVSTEAWEEAQYTRNRDFMLKDLGWLKEHFVRAGMEARFDDVYKQLRQLLADGSPEGKTDFSVYQLSQRADFFETITGRQTTFSRPLLNQRDEPHADPEKYRRLHVILGDANMAPWSDYLKVGTALIVLDLIEDGYVNPAVALRDPLAAFKSISRDQDRTWEVELARGGTASALDVQELYLNEAERRYGSDPSVRDVLKKWEYVLNALRRQDYGALEDKIDWAIKERILKAKMARLGVGLDAPEIRKLDLRYHSVHPDEGIYYLFEQGGYVDTMGITGDEIEHAVSNPPDDTRAFFRGRAMQRFPNDVVSANWDVVGLRTSRGLATIPLNEPLRGTKATVGDLFEEATDPDDFVRRLEG